MEGRTIRLARIAFARSETFVCVFVLFFLLHPGSSSAFESRRGYVRSNQFPSCANRCDLFLLDPDSGFSGVNLTNDPFSTVNLNSYVDKHVEVTGYRAGCSGCSDLYVSIVQLLSTDEVVDEGSPPAVSLLRHN